MIGCCPNKGSAPKLAGEVGGITVTSAMEAPNTWAISFA